MISQFPMPYNNEMSRAEYLKYGAGTANNGYYSGSGPIYYPGPNGWVQRIPQPPHGKIFILFLFFFRTEPA